MTGVSAASAHSADILIAGQPGWWQAQCRWRQLFTMCNRAEHGVTEKALNLLGARLGALFNEGPLHGHVTGYGDPLWLNAMEVEHLSPKFLGWTNTVCLTCPVDDRIQRHS